MKKFGLLGEKLNYSFSPVLHKIIFDLLEIKDEYHLFEVPKKDLNNRLQKFYKEISGCNVTIPYKQDVMNLIDEIDVKAKRMGAVNTILFKENKSFGYNTDYFGFGETLKKYNVPIKNKKAYILGTGGASKAVYWYLADNGIAEIIFVSRNSTNKTNNNCKVITYDNMKSAKGDIIINCTPVGMSNRINESPVDEIVLENFNYAVDLIYNPEVTLFLQYAQNADVKIGCNGLYMLVAQAVKSEEIWQGIELDSKFIDKVYEKVSSILAGS